MAAMKRELLPKTVKPERLELHLRPDFSSFTFSGALSLVALALFDIYFLNYFLIYEILISIWKRPSPPQSGSFLDA